MQATIVKSSQHVYLLEGDLSSLSSAALDESGHLSYQNGWLSCKDVRLLSHSVRRSN